MDFNQLLDSALAFLPSLSVVFKWVGIVTVVGTAIDAVIPDKYDKGFMGKILNVPVLGSILTAIKRFSPFNVKVEKK